ncbi:MAG TPA: hypothetical protein PKW55_05900 [Spirochaetota bacterium]|nr:hypothetical protein [Spirochaetota bacterium]HOM38417.1 hypothetical protein [Spirochaetota bacterium]HPQ48956.1 hypothetical protein [Spirochaetota bacterium]
MGVKEIPLLSDKYIKNLEWFRENRNKLSKYEGNWILICDKEVIFFSPNPVEIKEFVEQKKINYEECFIHYLVNANCIF